MAYERITVVGNIGSVEAQPSRQGNIYIRMTVAVDRGYGDKASTVWYTVLLFGAMAADPETFKSRYRKGRLVLVEGRPQPDAYIRQDGTAALDNSVIAITVPQLLDYKVS